MIKAALRFLGAVSFYTAVLFPLGMQRSVATPGISGP